VVKGENTTASTSRLASVRVSWEALRQEISDHRLPDGSERRKLCPTSAGAKAATAGT
jgi:hypothetical protein